MTVANNEFFFSALKHRFGRECYLDFDAQVTCRCPEGYQGRQCESCAPGYEGNPLVPGDYCKAGRTQNTHQLLPLFNKIAYVQHVFPELEEIVNVLMFQITEEV